jgi:hypothetical protein
VIGQVERLIDEGIEIDLAALPRHPTRMLQHALEDAVGALAVLGDLFEIAGQHSDHLVEFGVLVVAERGDRRSLSVQTGGALRGTVGRVRPSARFDSTGSFSA